MSFYSINLKSVETGIKHFFVFSLHIVYQDAIYVLIIEQIQTLLYLNIQN